MIRRRRLHGVTFLIAAAGITMSAGAPLRAAEPAGTAGLPLTEREFSDASQFCFKTLTDTIHLSASADRICSCFPGPWRARTTVVERLALHIALSPASQDARATVWTLAQLQGGLHDTLLQQASDRFKNAVRGAIDVCRR